MTWVGWLFQTVLRFLGALLWRLTKSSSRAAFKVSMMAGRAIVEAGLGLWRGPPQAYGSARWATMAIMRKAGLLGEEGLIVGKVNGHLLRDVNNEGSIIVLAPQGAGKGMGPVVSNLLDYKGSILVTDPKGENFAITSRHRATFGPVYRLDVTNTAQSHCFNPMSSIRWGTEYEPDDAEVLANLMLKHDANDEQHWRDKAKAWLTGFIVYVGHVYRDTPDLVTLAQVNKVVNAYPETFKTTIERMAKMASPTIREVATQILAADTSEESRSIMSTLHKGTGIWSIGKPLALVSGHSDFRFEDLYQKTITVYLRVSLDKLQIYGPFLRVMTGLAFQGELGARSSRRPSLTAPARAGVSHSWVGMKGWAPQGAEQKDGSRASEE